MALSFAALLYRPQDLDEEALSHGFATALAGFAVAGPSLLLTELPDDRPYGVVFMRRDLREVVKSQSTMLARSGRAGGGLPPERLMAVYEQQLKAVEGWLAARPAFAVLDVPYAGLVADPGSWVPRMLRCWSLP